MQPGSNSAPTFNYFVRSNNREKQLYIIRLHAMFNIASCNFLLVITDSEHGKYLNFFKPSADGQSFKRAKSS